MPRQNRVTPFGELIAISDRGMLMGNRGVLHDEARTIRRTWQLKRWILCVLKFKDRKRVVMSPGRYTELFFLDEATGLAAGHRPCAECQRARFLAFRTAWITGTARASRVAPTATVLDDHLHAERINRGEKVSYEANIDELPDGVCVTLDRADTTAWLLWRSELFAWSPGGYRHKQTRPGGTKVSVLTPRSTVAAIQAGFVPQVHPTAE
jgi:hypothetical protein